MNINAIENLIINRLKSAFHDVLVEGFPDKPSEFVLLHPTGALLVHYQGSNYSNTNSLACVTQETKQEFAITIVTRNLRSNDGAYQYLDKIKRVLTGYSFPQCTPLIPTKDYFISENSGIWQYGINFSLTTQNVQNY